MSQIEIREANFADEEKVINLLEEFYPGIPDHWRKLFKPRDWHIGSAPGFVIQADNKIVGFLGTIFSEINTVHGKHRICNLTSWYVDPKYRQQGMALFFKVMKLPNTSWTNLSPAPHIYDWLVRSGFKVLQDFRVLILPLPRLLLRTHIQITTKVNIHDLSPEEKIIFNQHKDLACKHILIKYNNKQCYCLAVITKYKKIPLAKFYYISDTSLFSAVISKIIARLCWKLRVAYITVEGDKFKDLTMAGSWQTKIFPPRLYKSHQLTRDDLTLLNSELFVLGI